MHKFLHTHTCMVHAYNYVLENILTYSSKYEKYETSSISNQESFLPVKEEEKV